MKKDYLDLMYNKRCYLIREIERLKNINDFPDDGNVTKRLHYLQLDYEVIRLKDIDGNIHNYLETHK